MRDFLLGRVVEASELHQLALVHLGRHPFRFLLFLKASGESPGSAGTVLHPVVATLPPVTVVPAATTVVAFVNAPPNVVAEVDAASLWVAAVGVASTVVVGAVATPPIVVAESVAAAAAAVSLVYPTFKTTRVSVGTIKTTLGWWKHCKQHQRWRQDTSEKNKNLYITFLYSKLPSKAATSRGFNLTLTLN